MSGETDIAVSAAPLSPAGAMIPAKPARYDRGSVAFHWTIAGLVLMNLPIGVAIHLMEESWADQSLANFHKPIGLLILALTLGRISWRVTHPAPALPLSVKRIERVAARTAHGMLYALTIATPLAGWWMTSAFAQHPISFGWWDAPFLPVERGMEPALVAHDIHRWLAILLALVAAGHMAAALRHHFMLRDGVLPRIAPWLTPRQEKKDLQ